MSKDISSTNYHNQLLTTEEEAFHSERMTIAAPFSVFYKIRETGSSQVLHMAFTPGHIISELSENHCVLHRHDHFELMYVLKGELTNQIEHISYTYKKGDACLLNRNTRHADTPGPGCAVVFLNFSPSLIRSLMEEDLQAHSEIPRTPGVIHRFLFSNLQGEDSYARSYLEFSSTLRALSLEEMPAAELLIDWIQQELPAAAPGFSFLLKGMLLRLIAALEEERDYHSTLMRLDSSNEELIFARISNYMKETDGCISRPQLSKALSYNAEYLNQIVKRRTGESLLTLAGSYRLEKARKLLSGTDESILAISQALGFSGTSHFYEFFRRRTGLSPREFREQAQRNG